MEEEKILIIDHGSFNIRYGLTSADNPKVIRSLYGTKRVTVGKNMIIGHKPANEAPRDIYYDEEAIAKANILRIDNTLVYRTEIKQAAKGLFKKILDDLNLYDGEKYNEKVLYMISTFVEKIFIDDIMNLFNELKVNKVVLVPQAKCASYLLNADCILDIGDNVSEISFIKENKIVNTDRSLIGASDLTQYLRNCFEDGEYFKFNSLEEIRIFKEKHIKFSTSEDDIKEIEKIKLTVDDGSEYEFGNELITCSEILINPSLIHKEDKGIIELIKNIVEKEKIERLCVIGQSSKIKNISERIKSELKESGIEFLSHDYDINVINWLGAKKMIKDGIQLSEDI